MVQNATSTSSEAEKEGNKYYMFTTVKAPYSGTYKIENRQGTAIQMFHQREKRMNTYSCNNKRKWDDPQITMRSIPFSY